jgi:hypothetical protein
MINKWKKILSLNEWEFTTESIDPNAVMYNDDCPAEDRYYVGVEPNHDTKTATIYHDRELTERDIIHELLHVRYPIWTEDQVNEAEELLYNINKDEESNT